MVMVANRKDRDHMHKDLGLFLGPHAEVFTGWLFGVLDRLKSLASDDACGAQPITAEHVIEDSTMYAKSSSVVTSASVSAVSASCAIHWHVFSIMC